MKTIKFISSLFILAAAIQSCQPKTDQAAIDKAQAEGKKSALDSVAQILTNQADPEIDVNHEQGHVDDTYPPMKAMLKGGSCPVMYGLVISDHPAHLNDTLIFVNMTEWNKPGDALHLENAVLKNGIRFDRHGGKKLKWLNGRKYPLAIPIWPQ